MSHTEAKKMGLTQKFVHLSNKGSPIKPIFSLILQCFWAHSITIWFLSLRIRNIFSILSFFLVVALSSEPRTWLLDKHSMTCTTLPALFAVVVLQIELHDFCPCKPQYNPTTYATCLGRITSVHDQARLILMRWVFGFAQTTFKLLSPWALPHE
jgi:hypothetical protein